MTKPWGWLIGLFLLGLILGITVISWVVLPPQILTIDNLTFKLFNKQLKVYQTDKLIWKTEKDFKVTNFLIDDIDHDGDNELAVVLWKFGYYGPDLPFWETENILDWGNHLFIYDLDPEIKLIWGSSTIPYTINSIKFSDGKLIVNQTEEWIWDQFGFTKVN